MTPMKGKPVTTRCVPRYILPPSHRFSFSFWQLTPSRAHRLTRALASVLRFVSFRSIIRTFFSRFPNFVYIDVIFNVVSENS